MVSIALLDRLTRTNRNIAWNIGRSIAIARAKKIDVVDAILESQSGMRLFSGKITSITRKVEQGFTRGTVTLEAGIIVKPTEVERSISIVFENENLYAIQHSKNKQDEITAICPDLIIVSILLFFKTLVACLTLQL